MILGAKNWTNIVPISELLEKGHARGGGWCIHGVNGAGRGVVLPGQYVQRRGDRGRRGHLFPVLPDGFKAHAGLFRAGCAIMCSGARQWGCEASGWERGRTSVRSGGRLRSRVDCETTCGGCFAGEAKIDQYDMLRSLVLLGSL